MMAVTGQSLSKKQSRFAELDMTFGNAFLTLLVASGRKGSGASLRVTPSDISGASKNKVMVARKIGKNKTGKMNHPDEVILEVRRLHKSKWSNKKIHEHLKAHGIDL